MDEMDGMVDTDALSRHRPVQMTDTWTVACMHVLVFGRWWSSHLQPQCGGANRGVDQEEGEAHCWCGGGTISLTLAVH